MLFFKSPNGILLIISVLFGLTTLILLFLLQKKIFTIKKLQCKISDFRELEEKIFALSRDLDKTKKDNKELNDYKVILSTRLLLIEKFAESINSHLETKNILNSLLENLKRLFSAEKVEIFMRDSHGEVVFFAAIGWNKEGMKKFKVNLDNNIIGFLFENIGVLSRDEIKKNFHLSAMLENNPVDTLLAASLISLHNNEIIGVVNISKFSEKRIVTVEDIRSFSILIKLTSLALNNAELFYKTKMLANIDGLTKLYNHRYFQDFLKIELERHKRYQRTLSIILSDIDHFKKFNDTYGHQAGDFVLKEVAYIFRKNIRKKLDLAARYGGEEFVVVLPETTSIGAKKLAERIRKLVEDKEFFYEPTGDKFRVTISLGIATFPVHAIDTADLIKKADDALYKAKKMGRNRVCQAE